MSLSVRQQQLSQRRRDLVAQSRAQRARLLEDMSVLTPCFRVGDKLLSAAGWVTRNGVIIVAVAAAVIAVRKPSRLIQYAGRAWSLWQVYREYRTRIDGVLERMERRV